MARASHATSFPRRVRPASAARTGWPPSFALSPGAVVRPSLRADVSTSSFPNTRRSASCGDVRPRAGRGSAFEGSLDDNVAANHALSARRRGEPLSEFAIGAGRFVARRKRDSEVRVAAWVLISAAPQAPRSDRLREQARPCHPGVDERFAPARRASSPPRLRSSGRLQDLAGEDARASDKLLATSSSRQVRYEPGRAARATSPAGTERSSPGLQPVRRVTGGVRAVVTPCGA
ncbi:hypothetical protein DFR50_11260 [Roseiarcus fermentans]|uniref:Uncharacterized protein n=1 Tax=Roseiarcus fermentans TaxID=1473586 RepID=A0A366FEQ9_9HYPH|nr:hypothetical protein DFR50_11260 [Roseiarcus fermentans]